MGWNRRVSHQLPSLFGTSNCVMVGRNQQENISPGDSGSPVDRIPDAARALFGQKAGQPSIFLFAHPYCPFASDTVKQLELLTKHLPVGCNCRTFIYWPIHLNLQKANSETTQQIAKLPGMAVTMDRRGVLTESFGVRTSGHVLVYNRNERLGFSGGISNPHGTTPGPQGILSGSSLRVILESLINNLGDSPVTRPVFGCPLFESRSNEAG